MPGHHLERKETLMGKMEQLKAPLKFKICADRQRLWVCRDVYWKSFKQKFTLQPEEKTVVGFEGCDKLNAFQLSWAMATEFYETRENDTPYKSEM